MSTILIAEDEERIAAFVEKGLRSAGYTTTRATRGDDALAYLRSGGFDLVLLDVGLPGMDGFAVLRALRAEGESLPVIMLTARSSVTDTVEGLDLGANDYLAKPFRFDELLARIRLRLRESAAAGSGADDGTLVHGGVALDLRSRRATVEGGTVDLSAREFALAEEFLRHPEQVLSREQLLSRVWGYDFDPGSNVVDVYVRYLRGKIGADRIETVRGMGYRMVG
ncbi:DNA-binding response regulator [Rathayibacter caricis DSM 15933]|uniref:DNA-binding response regulator n=1 Tax=Rathayibacter caricis DSM 15933 TaxID=1328867 RepID=A0A2T4UXH9_9MICO|nr:MULTISPECIES: response regulator transcription factor [Rathayibacter]KQQ19216.1 two-component system response regulator [Rathayibacter sp. Leaf299]PTL74231.1 DNA-binding response regulator [Rathayibacter caricis DSM 15933]